MSNYKTTLERNLPIAAKAKSMPLIAVTSSAPPKTGSGAKPRILVVDDEKAVADSLVFLLKHEGFDALAAYSGEDARQASARTPVHLLISDVMMPGLDGVETAIGVCQLSPACRVILFSGHDDAPALVERARANGYDFELIRKPLHPQELLAKLRLALSR